MCLWIFWNSNGIESVDDAQKEKGGDMAWLECPSPPSRAPASVFIPGATFCFRHTFFAPGSSSVNGCQISLVSVSLKSSALCRHSPFAVQDSGDHRGHSEISLSASQLTYSSTSELELPWPELAATAKEAGLEHWAMTECQGIRVEDIPKRSLGRWKCKMRSS